MSLPPPVPSAPSPAPGTNKTLLWVGLGGGCLLILVFSIIAAVAGFYFVRKVNVPPVLPVPKVVTPIPAPGSPLAQRPAATPKAKAAPAPSSGTAPHQAQIFLNQREGLESSLANQYVDCVLAYPDAWSMDESVRKAGRGFIRLSRKASAGGAGESFTLSSWARDPGLSDQAAMQAIAQRMSAAFRQALTNYQQLTLGRTRAGLYEGLELKFSAQNKEGQPVLGRLVFLSRQTQDQGSAPLLTLIVTGPSAIISNADDVGVRGELPLLINTFRWGNDVAKAGATFQKQADGSGIIFSLLDLTEDGTLSGSELLDGELRRFDRNGDGRVTLDEYRAGNTGK